MDAMIKRRDMMATSSMVPEWDVVWDGSSGSQPPSPDFTKTTGGTASVSMGTISAKIIVKGSGSYCKYDYFSNAAVGVIEAELAIFTSGGYWIVRFGDGTHEISVSMYYNSTYKGIYLRNASAQADRTKLKTVALSTRYVIKLVFYGTTGDVYVDDEIVAQGVDLDTIPFNSNERSVSANTGSSSNTQLNVYSIKLKLGRTA